MRAQKARQSDSRAVFSTVVGKRVLRDLEQKFAEQNLHVPGDPYGTSFRAGQHSVVVYLHRQLSSETIIDEGETG